MPEAGVPVLIGEDNFLFLTNDTNDSVRQFTGEIRLSENAIAAWTKQFRLIKDLENKYNYKSAFLVSPAKEYILPELMPHNIKRGEEAPIDAFRRIPGAEEVVYPINQLRRLRYFSYERTDSHWSDAGSAIAACEVMKSWGLEIKHTEPLMSGFCLKMSIGDLGVKLDPKRADYSLKFDWSVSKALKFDNALSNHGSIKCFSRDQEHPDEPKLRDDTVLIFGDSFSYNLAPALSRVFKEVYFAYKPGCLDYDLIDIVRPQFVLHEIAQRFIIGQPSPAKSIFDTAAEKFAALPPSDKLRTKENIKNIPGHPKHDKIMKRVLSYM